MISTPPTPPAYERILEQKLVECGLKSDSFTVKYEDYLQNIGIVIGEEAGASAENLDCIRTAAGLEIVTFRSATLQKTYEERTSELLRPKMLADARNELAKRGLLNGFPERASFASDKLFAEALERHCGVEPGSFFVVSQWGLTMRPTGMSKAELKRTSCLMAAVVYVSAKGEPFKFGFTGNEAISPTK